MKNMNCEPDFNWSGTQLVPVQGFGWLPACVQGEVGDRFKVGIKVSFGKKFTHIVYNYVPKMVHLFCLELRRYNK
jgi:hypothetical protein